MKPMTPTVPLQPSANLQPGDLVTFADGPLAGIVWKVEGQSPHWALVPRDAPPAQPSPHRDVIAQLIERGRAEVQR